MKASAEAARSWLMAIGFGLLLVAQLGAACQTPSPTPPIPTPPDAGPAPILDGGALHSYTCPVGDGGHAWTCQDGLTQPVGTCARYGCVPVVP